MKEKTLRKQPKYRAEYSHHGPRLEPIKRAGEAQEVLKGIEDG